MSYKAGIGDTRESPGLKILELRGGSLVYSDPHVPSLEAVGYRHEDLDAALDGADLAVLVTAHPSVNHGKVVEHGVPLLDLRGTTRSLQAQNGETL